jgi:hypothetical protein
MIYALFHIVAQIGNAWPHNMGKAIMLAILSQQSDIRPLLVPEPEAA